MAADFDKWTIAVGDAANLRRAHGVVRQQLGALIEQRDRLLSTAGADSAAYRDARAQVDAKAREEATFAPRIRVAEADAAFYEPSPLEKQQRYCADAARGRALRLHPTVQTALDAKCRQAGGDPTTPLVLSTAAPPVMEPSVAPTLAPTLPIVPILLVAAAAAGGLYYWSTMRRSA